MADRDMHPTPNLLGLPPSLRQRIYDHLKGLFAPTAEEILQRPSIEYCYDLGRYNKGENGLKYDCSDFYGLLLSCRKLYSETSQILYSTNRFSIRYSTKQSLDPLRNLTPASLAALSHLRIVLAEGSCHDAADHVESSTTGCCLESQGLQNDTHSCQYLRHNHDEPLEVQNPQLVFEWCTTVACLLASVTANQLHLAVICDVDPSDEGVQWARSLMAPLSLLPKLKNCSIRLCKKRDARLQELAHQTVMQTRRLLPYNPPMKGNTKSKTNDLKVSTRPLLLSLPLEVRLMILEYTDLITPWAEVEWNTQGGFRASRYYCDNLEFLGATCPVTRHHGCQFLRCSETYPEPRPGCFCRLQHSAFSSARAGACRCWESPLPLFLVCKSIYKDAQAVFYSGNHFIVRERYSYPEHIRWVEESSGGFAPTVFLRTVVPDDCLRYLRFLEIVLPIYDQHHQWQEMKNLHMQLWLDTLEWANHKLNLNGLAIRLVAAEDWEPFPRSHSEILQILDRFGIMTLAFSACGYGEELQAFWAQPPSPLQAIWVGNPDMADEMSAVLKQKVKSLMESMVLGPRKRQELEASRRVKEPGPSIWTEYATRRF